MRRLMVLLLAATVALAPLPAGALSLFNLKNDLVQFLLEQINDPGVFEVAVETVETPEAGGTRLVAVQVSDAEGVWLAIDTVEFAWDPARLLNGEIEISRLLLENPTLSRLPDPGAAEESGLREEETDLSWPRSPLALFVRQFTANNVAVAEGVLPQAIRFDATGRVRDEGNEQALTLDLNRRDTLPGAIAITYLRDFSAETLQLDIAGQEAPGGLVAAFTGLPEDVPVRIDLQAAGPDSDWAMTLDVAAEEVIALTGSAQAAWKGPISIKAALDLTPGPKMEETPRQLLEPTSSLRIDAQEAADGRIAINLARISAPVLEAAVAGWIERTTGVVELSAGIRAKAPLSALLEGAAFEEITFAGTAKGTFDQLDAEGDLVALALATDSVSLDRAELNVSVTRRAAQLAFDLAGRAEALRLAALGATPLEPTKFSAQGTLADSLLTLDAAELSSARLGRAQASGTVALDRGSIDIAYTAEIPDLRSLAGAQGLEVAGAAAANGQVSGPLAGPAIVGEIASRGARLGRAGLGTVLLTHDVTLGAAPQGHVALSLAGSDVGDGRFDTDFVLEGERLRLAPIKGDLAALQLEGVLETDLASSLTTGNLALSSPNLEPLGRMLDRPLEGALQGVVELAAGDGGQQITWEIDARNIVTSDISIATAETHGTARDLFGAPDIAGALQLSDTAAGAVRLAHTSLAAEGPLTDLEVTLETAGTAAEDLPLEATARARVSVLERATEITVSEFQASIAEEPLRLVSPLRIALTDAGTSIDALHLALPDKGSLKGSGTLAQNGFAGDLALDALPLRLAKVFAEAPIEAGRLSGDLEFDTRPQSAEAKGTLNGEGLRLEGAAEETGDLDLALALAWDGRVAEFTGSLSGGFGDPAQVSLELPVVPGDGPLPELRDDGAIAGSLTWRGEIAPLWALVPLPDHLLGGEADIDAQVAGTMADPRLSGGITLSEGHYQNLTAGTILTDLTVETTIRDSAEVLLTLRAKDGAEGSVTGEVALDLTDQDLVIDADFTAANAVLVRRDDAVMRIDAQVGVQGPSRDLEIAGDITITEAEIRLINRLPPSVVDLGPVKVRGAPPAAEAEADPGRIDLDLRVRAPGRIFIRGRGLESEWSAELDVGGSVAQPLVTGSITALRGRLDLVGKQFLLTEGKIKFSGGPKVDPAINIVLSREADDIVGRVILEGFASAPELRFESTPAVPEDEVLPRIIFGRSAQSLTPFEAVQLAAGVAALSSGEAGFIDSARASLGIDVLQFDTDAKGASSLTVGRYVSDGAYVGARQAVNGKGGAAVIELEVIDNITVDAELGQEGQSSAGINWKFDF